MPERRAFDGAARRRHVRPHGPRAWCPHRRRVPGPRLDGRAAPRSTADGVFSSASSSINGQKRVELQFSLSGGGTATLRGESQGVGGDLRLSWLQVHAAGKVVDVPVEAGWGEGGGTGSGGGSGAGGHGGGRGGRGEIIDIESRAA